MIKALTQAFKAVFMSVGLLLVFGGIAVAVYLYEDVRFDDGLQFGVRGRRLIQTVDQAFNAVQDGRELAARKRDHIAYLDKVLDRFRGVEPVRSEPGSIRVLFAPCSPADLNGIDDQFINLLKSAERSIYCAFYDLELDDAADALISQWKRGVDVAIVSDSDYREREAIKRCIAAGIMVAFDERTGLMHNKFCVIDEEIVWTGSTNITYNGMYRNNNNALLLFSNQLADNYLSEFEEMFAARQFGPTSPSRTPHPVLVIGDIEIENYFAPEDNVRRALLDKIAGADATLDFMMFSFTADEISRAMVKRIEAGVAVRGLFEARNAASKYSEADFLEQEGARVYMDSNPYSMHHKVMVIDEMITVTGSYNFSDNADESNDENVLIIRSSDIAEQYTEEFERLIAADSE